MKVDHATALEDASYKREYSNLARAYIDYAEKLTELAAENARLRDAVERSQQATGSLERWLTEKDPDLVLPLALGLMLIDSRQKREAALSQDPPHDPR